MEEREWSWKRTDRKAKKLAVKELPYQLDGSIIEDQVPELPRDRGMRKVLEHVISSTQGNFDALRGELIKSGQYHNEHADETNYMKNALLPHEHPESFGIKQASLVPPGSGFERYFYPFMFYVTRENTRANGGMKALPFWVGRDTTVSNLYCEYTVASGAGGVVRMGIYQGLEEYGWLPGPLVKDCGTAITTAGGGDTVQIAADQQLVGGNWYWLASAPQGSPAPAATFVVVGPYFDENGGTTMSPNTLFAALFGTSIQLRQTVSIFANGITGALPNPWPYDSDTVVADDDLGAIEMYYSTEG